MNQTKYLLLIVLFIFQSQIASSTSKNVLFVGNSYIAVNNLPQIVSDLALSAGDTVNFNSSTPGGYTLQSHFNDATTMAWIAIPNWDYVVLQEQSQLPSFPLAQVQSMCFPYAHLLDSTINAVNHCAETVFFMTWGRKNGDASNCSSWPPVCTYEGMDSLLALRYQTMANDNHALVSPVGAVWRYIRTNFPGIELYISDESHPSMEGSYAAACTFYSVIFRKDPELITNSYGLDSTNAANIRHAAKLVAYDQLMYWNVGKYDPIADFNYINNGGYSVSFSNNSMEAEDYNWDFGDGSFSTDPTPTHFYSGAGIYNVKLMASKCGLTDTISDTISVVFANVETVASATSLQLSPQPCSNLLTISSDSKNTNISDLVIFDLSGRKVYEQNAIDKKQFTLSVKEFSNGIYILKVIDTFGNAISKRMIKVAGQ
jgi:hypothetical protein